MSTISNNLYAGRFTGKGQLSTSEGTFTLYSSEASTESSTLLHNAKEREGQYAIIKAVKQNNQLYDCELIETLDPISSRLLERLILDSPHLKTQIISLVRNLRDELLGKPEIVLSDEEASLQIKPSGSKPIVALVVGHRQSAKGAEGMLNGNRITEFDYFSELALMIEAQCQHAEVLIVYRDDNKSGYSRLPGKINNLNPEFVVSLHANAHNKTVSGTETLYYRGSKKGIQLARIVQVELLKALKLNDRKVKSKIKGDRGGSLLSGTHAPAVIGEPFFIDNPSDLKIAVTKQQALAKAYAKAIDQYAVEISDTKPTATAKKTSQSTTLKITIDLQHHNLTKAQFLKQNKPTLLKLIDGVNDSLLEKYGSNFSALTQTDFWVLFNSEAGLKSGKVDIDHRHSEGERGILPLPSNIAYWNGGDVPAWDRPMPIGKNIEHFMLYLGNLKNKKVAKQGNLWMYQSLFQNTKIKGHVLREARTLSGVVHGYFYSGNFSDKKVPVSKILEGFTKDSPIPEIMDQTKYVHAKTKILVNREVNINEAITMV